VTIGFLFSHLHTLGLFSSLNKRKEEEGELSWRAGTKSIRKMEEFGQGPESMP